MRKMTRKLRNDWRMAAILNPPSWIFGFPKKIQDIAEIKQK